MGLFCWQTVKENNKCVTVHSHAWFSFTHVILFLFTGSLTVASTLPYFNVTSLAVGLLMPVMKNYLHSSLCGHVLILTEKHKSNFDIRLTLNVTRCLVIDHVQSFCSK